MAIDSVNTLFSLLATQLGILYLKPQNLIVGSSLEYFNNGKLGNFDGVFNNPPWDDEFIVMASDLIRSFHDTFSQVARPLR